MRKRYPRIPSAESSGELARRIWRSPKFVVRERHGVTEFVHQLPFFIPDKIRRTQIGTFNMLFASQAIDMKKEIENAYRKARYRGRPVGPEIDSALRSVFTEAMAKIFMMAKKADHPYARLMKGGRKKFAEAARPRRVADKEKRERRATRLARLYQKVLPTAAEILEFMKRCDYKNEYERCKTDLEKKFPRPWINYVTRGRALQNLPEIPGHDASQALSNLRCTRRQLAVGIVWAIEDKRGEQPSLSANTILEDYIPLGAKLLGIGGSSRHS